MKFSLVIAFALVGFVVAQSPSSSAAAPINTANIPACVLKCSTQAAQTAGCTTAVTDPSCICKNPGFLTAVEPCIQSSCSEADHQTAMQLYQSICGALPTGTAPATGTAQATSGSQSATQPLATPSNSSATSAVPSTATASAGGSSNAAVAISGVDFAARGMWAAVVVGGAGIAQLVL